jgi:hypothetical protein
VGTGTPTTRGFVRRVGLTGARPDWTTEEEEEEEEEGAKGYPLPFRVRTLTLTARGFIRSMVVAGHVDQGLHARIARGFGDEMATGLSGSGLGLGRRNEKSGPKPAFLRPLVLMARPGLEPGTPRFSVVCSTN